MKVAGNIVLRRGLHVETHGSHIRDGTHPSDGSHHFPFDVLEGLSLRFRNVEDHKEETDAANASEEPEGTVVANSG